MVRILRALYHSTACNKAAHALSFYGIGSDKSDCSKLRIAVPKCCFNCRYEIMLSCWNETVPQRPSFATLRAKLDQMLSAEGNNPYVDFSINPNNLCYQVADDADASPNGLLHALPSGNKRRSQISSKRSSVTSFHNISPSGSIGRSASPAPRVRWARTPSPKVEKPHAANPMCVEEKERPRSMMLLRNTATDDDRLTLTCWFL